MGISAIAGAIADPSQLAAMFGFVPILIGPTGKELTIDVLESENPEYGFDITSEPVECGSDITDHTFEKPPSITLDCVFTDMQWSAKNIISGVLNGNLALRTWRDKKDELYRIKDAKQLINISTPLHSYKNYLIESIAPSVTAQSGDCFRCRITARHVNLVASAIGYVDPSMLPEDLAAKAETKTKGKSNKGAAKTKGADTAQTKRARTGKGTTADAYAY
jgi:hypothetical protein